MWDGRRFGAGRPAGALLNVARTELDPSSDIGRAIELKFLSSTPYALGSSVNSS